MNFKKQPWSPADATDYIREISKNPTNFIFKLHAKERMEERGIGVFDVLYVLQNGFVFEEPVPATREGFFKYKMESKTQNSHERTLRVVLIPEEKNRDIKIITVMFVDE